MASPIPAIVSTSRRTIHTTPARWAPSAEGVYRSGANVLAAGWNLLAPEFNRLAPRFDVLATTVMLLAGTFSLRATVTTRFRRPDHHVRTAAASVRSARKSSTEVFASFR